MARGKFKRNKVNKKYKNPKNSKRYHHRRDHSTLLQKRNASHLKEYGDSHPSEDAEGTSFKRRKMLEGRKTVVNVCDDDNESEKEQNLFKQLLKTFTGFHSESQGKSIESDITSEEDGTDDEKKFEAVEKAKHEQEGTFVENSDSENESLECDQKETDDDLDPFVRHFHYDLEENLLEAVSTLPQSVHKHQLHWPVLGQFTAHIPKATNKTFIPTSKMTLEDKRPFAKVGAVPQRITRVSWSQLHIKTQIQNNISKANFTNIREIQNENISPLTPLQKELFSIINNYQDLYYPERTLKNGEEIRFTYCLHSVNHILKTRTKILHHNNKLLNKDEVPEEYRDQGLVRPKVIILVPFREAALRYVKLW